MRYHGLGPWSLHVNCYTLTQNEIGVAANVRLDGASPWPHSDA